MITVSQAFIQAMTSPTATPYVRIELLDKNENVVQRFDTKAIDGSISVDKEQDVRRQFTLTVLNDDGAFTWSPGGLVWLDKRVKLYIGYQTPAGIEYAPQGVFLLSSPTAKSGADGTREVTLQGGDKWKLLDGAPLGRFTYTTTIDVNLSIDQAIKSLAAQAGVPASQCAFDSCAVVTPYKLTYQPGESIGKAIKDLADLAVYDCFFDVNGFMRFRARPTDLTTLPSVWTYDKSTATLYAGSEKVLDESQLCNKVFVIGGSSSGATVSAISVNSDPNDPLSTVNAGERLFIYNNGSPDPLITTVALAQARADWELQHRTQIIERQKITFAPNVLHEAGDIITIVDDWITTNGTYELLRFEVNLKANALVTGEAWKTRKVGA